jgi:hypothetical protein
MKELMIHVERIVRPVAASQSRKLRMRTDLLAHLESALVEERERFPNDERMALESAKRRLGQPADLTRQLQQTVPVVERLLLGRMPMPPTIQHAESRLNKSLVGSGILPMGHQAVLVATAGLLIGLPFFASPEVRNVMNGPGMLTPHLRFFVIGSVIGILAVYLASLRFVFSAASGEHFKWGKAFFWGAIVLTLHIALNVFANITASNRIADPTEIAICAALTIGLLALSAWIAHRVAIFGRAYSPWMTLNIAE